MNLSHDADTRLKLEESDRGHYIVDEISLDETHLRRWRYRMKGYKNNDEVLVTYHSDYANLESEIQHYKLRGYEPKGDMAEKITTLMFAGGKVIV
jgi:hypothetical protein